MSESNMIVPERFSQPDSFDGRRVDGSLEEVDYIASTHVRLWYNYQEEGYKQHHHAAMEIIYVVENNYRVIVNEHDFILNPGDFLFIPPNTLHELEPKGTGTRYICLIDLSPLRDFMDYQVIGPLLVGGYLLNAERSAQLYTEVSQLFQEAADAYFANKMLWESTVYIRLCQILVRIGRDHYRNQAAISGTPERAVRKEYETLAALLSWLDTHYSEEISLEDAAERSGFSKYYFTRLFKQITETTFGDYLARKRISAACAMLSTDSSITDIAFSCGFNNLTTFNRCFKKYTNCSPSDYRASLRTEHFGETFI